MEVKEEMIYKFCFDKSDKVVHLNLEQLHLIPYLLTPVEHKDDFLSCQNKNGEYVLNSSINYHWFIPILYSVTLKQPYILFHELSQNENLLDVLQLFDYPGVSPFACPLLKDEHLVLLKSSEETNTKRRIEYHRVDSIVEARNTAAEFILSISKNEYDLEDFHTIQSIFHLIMIIFSNKDIFSSQFRYHTLTIVKQYCFSSFSKQQKHQLPTAQKIIRSIKTDVRVYLQMDNQPLPTSFQNAFAWKGVYISLENNSSDTYPYQTYFQARNTLEISTQSSRNNHPVSSLISLHNTLFWSNYLIRIMDTLRLLTEEDHRVKKEYISEAKSTRSKHFNTLPKRSNIDKLKHRFGLKTQKYR